jgi:hypothetical protein
VLKLVVPTVCYDPPAYLMTVAFAPFPLKVLLAVIWSPPSCRRAALDRVIARKAGSARGATMRTVPTGTSLKSMRFIQPPPVAADRTPLRPPARYPVAGFSPSPQDLLIHGRLGSRDQERRFSLLENAGRFKVGEEPAHLTAVRIRIRAGCVGAQRKNQGSAERRPSAKGTRTLQAASPIEVG